MFTAAEFTLAVGVISCLSMSGTLARVGCDWILKAGFSVLAPGPSPIGSDFFSNLLGSFLMGVLDKFSGLKKGYKIHFKYF